MPRNGGRPVTSAELDAHLRPMREDIRKLVADQSAFAEFMTGALVSRKIQERIIKSRHFWMGAAVAMFGGLATAAGVIVAISHG